MRRVSLLSVEMTNFRSFVSARVDMRRDPGLRMIFGTNLKEPRLGANGAGKSTIWDAVCWCLFGFSVRGDRASDLMTDTSGAKSMVVETTWDVDDEIRVIRRTFKPERLFLDGEKAEQKTIDALLLSRGRFLSSVLFGQAKPLFIDMPVPDRGDLLDDVLGLGFWMRSADLATSKWNAAQLDLQQVQREVARLEGAIGELPSQDDLNALAKEYEVKRDNELIALRDQRRLRDDEYRVLRRAQAAAQRKAGGEDEIVAYREGLRKCERDLASAMAVAQAEMDRYDEDIQFFKDNGECPSCGQAISEETADEHVAALKTSRAAAALVVTNTVKSITGVETNIADADEKIHDLRRLAREATAAELAASNKRGEVTLVDKRIELLTGQPNPHAARIEETKKRHRELGVQVRAKRAEATRLTKASADLDFWRQGFRRVRMFCLRRVLAELEVETASAARSLGLVSWTIGFSGETENKSGTTKLGVRAVVANPDAKRSFTLWSPGEGQRVRCASSMGLASLIQRYSGVQFDLEVWDEPSAWLSDPGIEDLFSSLAERAQSRGKSIWVCDPRAGLAHGGFDEVWNVVKAADGSGSRIEVVRGG